ncbi:Golgi apyrase [Lachnellula suecica]|uniref:Golgi apyrase n=1 Tax=Lachnellula suecica TaxID=602035 RepID=A0A8T9C4D1_9HELO|nr:Golgi apyrase [Lachnellula suecica]
MGRWGVILDAGSSGTRVHVYRWLNSARARQDASAHELISLPDIHQKKSYTKKIKPGVSTFGDTPSEVGSYLQPLLDHALSIVPADQVRDTPIFLMATAGVRLLEKMKQNALLGEICAYAQAHTDFSLPDCGLHIQVIPGETEGLYGWIAANYLLGGFDSPDDHKHGKGHHTYGFLDMGGASAQIAFAPNSTEAEKHANDLKLLRMRTLNGESTEYKVFTTTWLGFGVNQARERYVEALKDTYRGTDGEVSHLMMDPCLPSGLTTDLHGTPLENSDGPDPVLVGTGQFKECVARAYPLLDKDAPCEDQPCLLHGQHVPAIDFDVNHFVGVSEYWHTTHEVFEMAHKDAAYDSIAYQKLVKQFCAAEWDEIKSDVEDEKWGSKVDQKTAQEVCFKAAWLINILHDGIGIPKNGLDGPTHGPGYNATKEIATHKGKGFLDPFQAVNKIKDMEVSWTLGKMVLYAAGQIPPSSTTSALPVGFGSNTADGIIPTDFQEAGSNANPVPIDTDDSWSEAAEDLAEKAHSRSTPGFLLFMLILILIGYVFRKRERRLRLYRTFRRTRRPGSPRKGGRSGGFFGASASKLFGGTRGSGGGNYERVLEDGTAASEFELGDLDTGSDDNEYSDSSTSESSRVGRASGLATPRINFESFTQNQNSSYFEPQPTQGIGLGVTGGGSAMDRSGLVVRTESRERLYGVWAGRRSRAGSPTRGKSPLMGALEEV